LFLEISEFWQRFEKWKKPEKKHIIISIAIVLALFFLMAVFFIFFPNNAECGNGVIEGTEQCDRTGCAQGFYCNKNCECEQEKQVFETSPQKSCSELGGFFCKEEEACLAQQLNAIEKEICCSAQCISILDLVGGQAQAVSENSPEQEEGQGTGLQLPSEEQQNSTGSGSTEREEQLACQLENGQAGIECLEQNCFGEWFEGCCAGMCISHEVQGFTECYNLCLQTTEYSESRCEEICSP
jgi:hypothetical protein